MLSKGIDLNKAFILKILNILIHLVNVEGQWLI